MSQTQSAAGQRPDAGAKAERRWAAVSLLIVMTLVFMATCAGVHQATMPQAIVQTTDPKTLHIAGEFIESNLGSAVEPDGSVTVRLIGQQYSFTPQCILVPAATPITFRGASADVVHGFLIQNTNVNLMLVPGYVSTISTRFSAPAESLMPCHEYCGTGHEAMWAHVRVIDRTEFMKLAQRRRRLDCVSE